MKSIFDTLLRQPRRLFLFDGLGALVSAFFLGVIFVRYPQLSGMPLPTLRILASLPAIFLLFDAYCFFNKLPRIAPFLRTIALLNGGYLLLSLYFLYQHAPLLSTLGWVYFISELLIISLIIGIEWSLAGQLPTTNPEE